MAQVNVTRDETGQVLIPEDCFKTLCRKYIQDFIRQ